MSSTLSEDILFATLDAELAWVAGGDVPRGWLDKVHQIGGQLREIQYIDPYPGAVDQDGGSRFQHVFTNMHAISE